MSFASEGAPRIRPAPGPACRACLSDGRLPPVLFVAKLFACIRHKHAAIYVQHEVCTPYIPPLLASDTPEIDDEGKSDRCPEHLTYVRTDVLLILDYGHNTT